jgi:hypothetical protein
LFERSNITSLACFCLTIQPNKNVKIKQNPKNTANRQACAHDSKTMARAKKSRVATLHITFGISSCPPP